MKISTNRLLVCAFILASPIVAAAAEGTVPLWVSNPPANTDRYQYFVGHASATASADAVFNASRDALSKLATADFGGPRPPNARYYGVEQIQLDKIRHADDGSYEVYVLYRYAHEALEAEKARQAREAAQPPHAAPPRGRLKLLLDHSDALIIVDGFPLAASVAGEPLELEVASGQYVDAEFTQFETVRAVRKFFIPPGKAEIREVRLQDRPGFVVMSADPQGTTVDSDEGPSLTLPSNEHLHLTVGKHVLTFQKNGYESQKITVAIQRDRTVTVPKVVLISSEEKLRRLADPPWVLELSPIGNHYGTTESPSVGAFTYGASLDRHLFGRLRARVGFFHGTGSNQEANPTDEFAAPIVSDTISSNYLELGLPIEAYAPSALQTFYVEPLWVSASQNIGGLHLNAQLKQQGIGGAISFRQYFPPGDDSLVVVGLGARVALTDYYASSVSVGGGASGKLALSLCMIELLIGI